MYSHPLFICVSTASGVRHLPSLTKKGEILAICKSDIIDNRIHIHRQLVEEFDTSNLNNMKSA